MVLTGTPPLLGVEECLPSLLAFLFEASRFFIFVFKVFVNCIDIDVFNLFFINADDPSPFDWNWFPA